MFRFLRGYSGETAWKRDGSLPEPECLRHGGRSKQIIVGDEKQEDFDRLSAAWKAEFEVEGQAGESLLQRVILNEWLLQRAERNYLDVEVQLGSNHAVDWTLEQHKKLELFLRYKTTAERAFARFFNMLRGLRKDRIREQLSLENVRQLMSKIAAEMVKEKREELRTSEASEKEGKTTDSERVEELVLARFSSERKGGTGRRKVRLAEQWEVTGKSGVVPRP